MFQYTTETIINSNKGNLEGDVRFKTETTTNGDFLVIDGVNTFRKENIKAVYHSKYREDKKETVTIKPGTLTGRLAVGDVVRLTIVLREEGSARASLQNAYLRKTKPFHFELEITEADKIDTAALAKIMKKNLALSDEKLIKVSEKDNTITIEAGDCYLRFDAKKTVKLEKVLFDKAGYAVATTEKLPVDVDTPTPGDAGAGTVARIVKDLRIPTNASINPFAADQGGRPIPGGKYDQYLIEYETERRHVSGVVVGSIDRSITSHVFFVESAVITDFETALKAMVGTNGITQAGKESSNVTSEGLTNKTPKVGSVE